MGMLTRRGVLASAAAAVVAVGGNFRPVPGGIRSP